MFFFSEALLCNRDSVTAMAAFGLATTTITLGCTQVVRLRTPLLMAQTLATLDELAGGRVVLAPGACTEKHARRHGLAPFTPAVALREWIETIRRLLAGERLTYRGQSVELEEARLNWRAPRPRIPFWIAAMSKTGLRVAGQIADGVLLDAHTSPDYVENAIKILRDAVREAGRDWGSFEVAQIVPCSVEETHDEAVAAVRWEAASRFESLNFPAETERRLRVGEPAINRDDFPMLMAALKQGGKAAVAEALPRTLIENTTATGTPDEVVARVERYRRAGVTFPLLRPQAPHQLARVMDLFARK
jgi:5,10-methylenetetrahydromethanopterin reductase